MMAPRLGDKGDARVPKYLERRDLKSLAKYMKSSSCSNVFLMLGAGVSTSAGIPDFRSPETGLYANLARLNLPFPEAVFEIHFFRDNPLPFYTLAKELYPGRYRPTLTHSFIKVLHSHSLLHTCLTQNIDTLERRAGVPADKIVEAHGSFATQRCIECKRPYDDEKFKKAVCNSDIPRCEQCSGLVKPDIVFYGEALPGQFFSSIRSLQEADLLIVIGTSLTVNPFANLVDYVPEGCPRVLINMEKVGSFYEPNDLVCLGKCDKIIRELCRELGWEEELDNAWKETADSVDQEENVPVADEDENVSGELEKITKDMEKSLTISEEAAPVSDISTMGDRGEDAKEPGKTIGRKEEVDHSSKHELEAARSEGKP